MTDSSQPSSNTLSRRERQIMDAVYAAGKLTAAQVGAALPDPPSGSAVRALLRILGHKGHLRRRREAGRYVYVPTRPRDRAGRSALRRVLQTFFDNSAAKAVAALMDVADPGLTEQELSDISRLIERARRKGGPS